MKAIHRLLDDMDKLTVNCLQELRILQKEPDTTPAQLCAYFTAVGAVTSVAGAIAGARLSLKVFE